MASVQSAIRKNGVDRKWGEVCIFATSTNRPTFFMGCCRFEGRQFEDIGWKDANCVRELGELPVAYEAGDRFAEYLFDDPAVEGDEKPA